jgi:hypothetical protein
VSKKIHSPIIEKFVFPIRRENSKVYSASYHLHCKYDYSFAGFLVTIKRLKLFNLLIFCLLKYRCRGSASVSNGEFMATKKIKDLQEGMILAGDVKDRNGMLIASHGQRVSEKHLRTFKSWGVTEVDIEESVREKTEAGLAKKEHVKVPEAVREDVDELFRYADKRHPAMVELMELCIVRKTESL